MEVAAAQPGRPVLEVVAFVVARAGQERIIRRAARVAELHHARLTVVCLWSPGPLWRFTALAGVDPVKLTLGSAEESAAWLRAACRAVPSTVSLTMCCRRRRGSMRSSLRRARSRFVDARVELDPRAQLVDHAQGRLELGTIEAVGDPVGPR